MAVKAIQPPNPLEKAKNGDGPVLIDPEVLDRAEKAVEKLTEDYSVWAREDIDGLRLALSQIRTEPKNTGATIAEIYRRALDLKGQGGGFGYDLITSVGDLLTRFMEARETVSERDCQIIEAHIDAMQAVINQDIKGSGGRIGKQIVAGLRELVIDPAA